MSRRIVLVKHHNDPNDDRASEHLAARGFELEWRFPYAGDRLGEPDGEIAGTVVYGGGWGVPDIERHRFLADEARWIEGCMKKEVPVLGLCLGSQVLAHSLGAKVGPHPEGLQEFGFYELQPTDAGRADGMPEGLHMGQMHYHCFDLPADSERLASSEIFPNQAIRANERTYGFQGHPERTLPGFRRWQEKPWAPWGKPGTQSREEQDRLAAQHDPGVHAWFTGFLDRLFGLPNA